MSTYKGQIFHSGVDCILRSLSVYQWYSFARRPRLPIAKRLDHKGHKMSDKIEAAPQIGTPLVCFCCCVCGAHHRVLAGDLPGLKQVCAADGERDLNHLKFRLDVVWPVL